MKKLISLILLLCLLTGCAASPQTPASGTTAAPSSTAAVTDPTLPAETDGPASLMDGRVSLGGPLFRLENQAAASVSNIAQCMIFQDHLLLASVSGGRPASLGPSRMGYLLQLLDLQTGELVAERMIENNPAPTLQLCGDRLVVSDSEAMQILVLDDKLQEAAVYPMPTKASFNYFNQSATAVYAFFGGMLEVYDLATGEGSRLFPTAIDVYPNAQVGNYLTFSYLPEGAATAHSSCIDLTTGEILDPAYDAAYSNLICMDGQWLGALQRSMSTYYMDFNEAEGFFTANSQYCSLLDGPAPLLLSTYTDSMTRLRLYRQDLSFFSGCALDVRDGTLSDPVWCEQWNGYFLVSQNGIDPPGLLFWDLSVPTEGRSLELIPMSAVAPAEGHAVAQSLYDRAEALSQAYGVEIRIADQCASDYPAFTVDPSTDYWTISSALDLLEKTLSAYPAGFMEQLLYDQYTKTEINLTSTIHTKDVPEDANGFTSFLAYVLNEAPAHIMILDITQYGLEQTIYHEFSHIIDDKLLWDSFNRASLYSEEGWAKLNPEGFEYIWNVFYVPDDYYRDGFDGYFVDTYARTFPSEDRARILEYAMADLTWVFEGPTQQPLRDKLAYYSACIRDCFDTTGWPEVTQWEKPLHKT